MWRRLIVLVFVVMLLTACNGYREEPTSDRYVLELNHKIDSARIGNASWTSSPESITRMLFPEIIAERNRKYSITSESQGISRIVVVVQEGIGDDEVLAERHTITFNQKTGKWTITNYRYETKRRY